MDTDSLYPKNPNDENGRPNPQSWIRGWWRETLAVGVSLCCTLCIALLLFVMKNRPLGEWAVPYISLPATLSILTTISKSTTALALAACISQYKWIYFKADARKLSDFNLLDHASRGPNGALFLILAKGPLMLASLGAVTTILSLALEPSVQQILNLTSRPDWVEDGKASFPIARRYEGGARGSIYADWYKPLDSPDSETVDIAMQAAIYNGLFNLTSRPAFSCPSETCKWLDSYVSLGFQSNCTDVTAETFRHWEASNNLRDGRTQYNVTTPGRVGLDLNIPAGGDEHPLVVVGSRSLLWSKADANRTTYTMKPRIARIAVYRGNSSFPFRSSNQPRYKNITECDITLVAYRYSEVKADNDTSFRIGKQETIPLELGVAVQWPTANSRESKNNILGSGRTRGLELWKDSSVALLSHDVTTTNTELESESDDGVKENEETYIAGPQLTVKELDKLADEVKAQVL